MQSKVSKYIDLAHEDLTLSPRSAADKAKAAQAASPKPASLDISSPKNKAPQTLTPVNVVQQIRRNIIMVLGLYQGITGRFTQLEERLIQAFEWVIRKGHCPSTIVRHKILFESLLCLKKYFDKEKVTISLDGVNGKSGMAEVLVFPALYHYGREAAYCERKIKELRVDIMNSASWTGREKTRKTIQGLKRKKDDALLFYQKIVFSDAEALRTRNQRRGIKLYGKDATLDDLVKYYKSGVQFQHGTHPHASIDDSLTTTGSNLMNPLVARRAVAREQRMPAREQTGKARPSSPVKTPQDDVVDWKSIKSKAAENRKNPKKNQHYDFNL